MSAAPLSPPDDLTGIFTALAERDFPARRDYSGEDALAVWHRLPRDLQLDAHKWGSDDTEVRDRIFVFLQQEQNRA